MISDRSSFVKKNMRLLLNSYLIDDSMTEAPRKKNGARNPGPTSANRFSKDLILIAACPGERMALAAGVRHDIVVVTF